MKDKTFKGIDAHHLEGVREISKRLNKIIMFLPDGRTMMCHYTNKGGKE